MGLRSGFEVEWYETPVYDSAGELDIERLPATAQDFATETEAIARAREVRGAGTDIFGEVIIREFFTTRYGYREYSRRAHLCDPKETITWHREEIEDDE